MDDLGINQRFAHQWREVDMPFRGVGGQRDIVGQRFFKQLIAHHPFIRPKTALILVGAKDTIRIADVRGLDKQRLGRGLLAKGPVLPRIQQRTRVFNNPFGIWANERIGRQMPPKEIHHGWMPRLNALQL